jgi:hypothetical protein
MESSIFVRFVRIVAVHALGIIGWRSVGCETVQDHDSGVYVSLFMILFSLKMIGRVSIFLLS